MYNVHEVRVAGARMEILDSLVGVENGRKGLFQPDMTHDEIQSDMYKRWQVFLDGDIVTGTDDTELFMVAYLLQLRDKGVNVYRLLCISISVCIKLGLNDITKRVMELYKCEYE